MKNGSYGCAKFTVEVCEHAVSGDVIVKIVYDALPNEARIATGEHAVEVVNQLRAVIESISKED